MDTTWQAYVADLWSADRDAQNTAFFYMLKATDEPATWAYTIWDEAVANLSHPDNHNRAIAAQILCNLAKSDPQKRILADFSALLAVTKDARFVTARHCLQAMWKIGVVGPEQRQLLVDGLESRFLECRQEKNGTLTRADILQSLRQVYAAVGDETVKAKALALIDLEEDDKYRAKYTKIWRVRRAAG